MPQVSRGLHNAYSEIATENRAKRNDYAVEAANAAALAKFRLRTGNCSIKGLAFAGGTSRPGHGQLIQVNAADEQTSILRFGDKVVRVGSIPGKPIAVSEDGSHIALAIDDHICVFDPWSRILGSVPRRGARVLSIAVSVHAGLLLVLDQGFVPPGGTGVLQTSTLRAYDLQRHTFLWRCPNLHPSALVSCSPCGTMLALSRGDRIDLCSLHKTLGPAKHTTLGCGGLGFFPKRKATQIANLSFSSHRVHGLILAALLSTGEVQLWKQRRFPAPLRFQKLGSVRGWSGGGASLVRSRQPREGSLMWSPGGRYLAVSSDCDPSQKRPRLCVLDLDNNIWRDTELSPADSGILAISDTEVFTADRRSPCSITRKKLQPNAASSRTAQPVQS
ncbi:MAG: hypothetical protein AAF355_03710 [Myxococcota bacterium]